MSVSIGRRTRAFLITASALTYLASLTDLSERLEAQGLESRAVLATPLPVRRQIAFVPSLVTRDPFQSAVRPALPSAEPRAIVRDGPGSASDETSDAGDPGVLVPDIATSAGAPLSTAGDSAKSVVRATLVGAHAVAYVSDGGDLQLVRVGDLVDGRRIAAIDERGIAFSNGSRLDLAGSYLATPAPHAPPRSRFDAVARELARLRASIERRGTPTASTATAASVPAPDRSTPVRRAPEPTAWPLPTADSRGLPVGVNPTPDASGPTAYPYPYPYPPVRH